MKTLFLFFASFFCFTNIYAQDSLKIKQIDSLVSVITHSNLPTQRDSTLQDYPGLGLSTKIYVTLISYGRELKKYAQITKTTREENKMVKEYLGGNAFYYDQNKLIKVEEFMIEGGKENKMEWYFSDDKCFFHTLIPHNAEDRAALLLNISNGFLKKFAGQNK